MGDPIGHVLVVGAGISGIRSALDLAETGTRVTLIDQSDHMGGILSQLDYQFPSDGCGMCRMLPMIQRESVSQLCLRKGLFHDNIDLRLSTTLASLEGEPGAYTALIREKQRYVNFDLCNGCGLCAMACPVEIPDRFNQGMGMHKAVFLPVPHSIPNRYVIDPFACTRCGDCVTVCPTEAITLPRDSKKDFCILIVDDELIVRDSLKEWFEFDGYTVDMAASGKEALEFLEKGSYSLMLLDLKMPEMDGTEVLDRTRAIKPDLPVVIMTAYATVETAVKTMKNGALEYVIKPFDTDRLLGMVNTLFLENRPVDYTTIELPVGAVILSPGTGYANPLETKNTYGYKTCPDVVTSIEFERILSGTGPFQGRITRPSDNRVPERIAWIQCVGSRDIQTDALYCSTVCCMHALKEASLVRKRSQGRIETVIYYMDMRCFGKTFDIYKQKILEKDQVILKRARPHTVVRNEGTGKLMLTVADESGVQTLENFDMVVLSLGQKQSVENRHLATVTGLDVNTYGFFETISFNHDLKGGVFACGSATGLKDIGESVISSSAAASQAVALLHGRGATMESKALAQVGSNPSGKYRDVSMENPREAVIVCRCPGSAEHRLDEKLQHVLSKGPKPLLVKTVDRLCTTKGWNEASAVVSGSGANRVLFLACLPYLFRNRIVDLAMAIHLDPLYMDVIDVFGAPPETAATKMIVALARIRHITASRPDMIRIKQQVLVVGAGLAGMTAAITLSGSGVGVTLVDQAHNPGGNLTWLAHNLTGENFKDILRTTVDAIKVNPLIDFMPGTKVQACSGEAGRFHAVLVKDNDSVINTEHGAVILATGGREAGTSAYGMGTHPCIITQKTLEMSLENGSLDTGGLTNVVMIQCVDSRDDIKPYCSRVCCRTSLKHALLLKRMNPETDVYILYRDMMSYGFSESFYKDAREQGVVFIAYSFDNKPVVSNDGAGIHVRVFEPTVGYDLDIESDLVVLATGIEPAVPRHLAELFGIEIDPFTFVQEADTKWRPVETSRAGIFSCGLALGPRDTRETIESARAAAMGALRIVSRRGLTQSSVTAEIRSSLCSLCQRCIQACPYGARQLNLEHNRVLVNPGLCQGCGSCAVVCANSASYVTGFTDRQILAMVDAAI